MYLVALKSFLATQGRIKSILISMSYEWPTTSTADVVQLSPAVFHGEPPDTFRVCVSQSHVSTTICFVLHITSLGKVYCRLVIVSEVKLKKYPLRIWSQYAANSNDWCPSREFPSLLQENFTLASCPRTKMKFLWKSKAPLWSHQSYIRSPRWRYSSNVISVLPSGCPSVISYPPSELLQSPSNVS